MAKATCVGIKNSYPKEFYFANEDDLFAFFGEYCLNKGDTREVQSSQRVDTIYPLLYIDFNLLKEVGYKKMDYVKKVYDKLIELDFVCGSAISDKKMMPLALELL